MSTSVMTGRHLSWLACSLLILGGAAGNDSRADDLPSAINGEFADLARAFRGLDQSYVYRGMSSRLASTAGSVFVDWEAKGVPAEHRHPVVAPEPIAVGCLKRNHQSLEADCACGHRPVPSPQCSACGAASRIPLHGSGSSCAATIGIPLHPRCNDCAVTIGVPLHPNALHQQGRGCETCLSRCKDCCSENVSIPCLEEAPCHDCFVVEQYRDGRMTRTLVPCDRCKTNASCE